MKRGRRVLLPGHGNVIMGFICFVFYFFLVKYSDARELSQLNNDVVGLMAFKQKSVHSDPKGVLASWTATSSSPCSWFGVSCSSDGRVTGLDLSNRGLVGSVNLADVAALPSLKNLDLHGNFFSAGNLSMTSCHLESINLSSNILSDPIPGDSFLLRCDNLSYVNLSKNSIPGGSLKFGPNLLQLDISWNRISDPGFLNSILSSCQNLAFLNISNNKLAGKLNVTLSYCERFATLDLSHNALFGVVPPKFLRDDPATIKYLDLSHNNFSGLFSDLDFGHCGNLTLLNLSHNKFSGSSFLPNLKNCFLLETLDISYNELGYRIPGVLLGNLKNLRKLSLAHNQLIGEIPPELGQLCERLEELDLSENNLTAGLPFTFASCSSLSSLNLGKNQLSGDFLGRIVSNIPSLVYLNVSFNNISGAVPLSLTNCTQLKVLDLSSNGFTGHVPSRFCLSSAPSVLEKIFLADNYLSGQVPVELGNCKNLRSIDLSFNSLSGSIPSEIWFLPSISNLVMWANHLTGTIPEGICVKGGNLETLILNNNFLSGSLPQSIGNCTNMIWVSLSSNKLSGEIPAGIGNLLKLAILQMGNNSLTGPIPPDIGQCRSLIWLDLNSNNITGAIPFELANQAGLVTPGTVSGKRFAFVRNEGGTSCRGAGGLVEFEGIRKGRLANFHMVHSCPSTRIYLGLTMYTFPSNGSIIYLDLSYNSLTGTIPDNFGALSYLQVMNLGHNSLTGNIPGSFGNLKAIGVLDLSHNNLQGFLPGSLGSLTFLSDLDVSNNNLTGTIPSGGQLTTFPTSRFENNSGLCGLPLPTCSSIDHTESSKGQQKKQPVREGVFMGITFFLLCIIVLAIALYGVKKTQLKEDQREKYIESLPTSGTSSWKLSSVPEPLSINVAAFEKPLQKLTFAHLLEATNGFSADSLVGSGGFGEVYKAQLKDGCVVAIKKLIHHTGQGDREFMAEMETIGKIKHRNLVSLLGYCKVGEERLLVYEYMKWGSLESVLHDGAKGGGMKLDWPERKKIAIGAARGLAFLHHSCIPHIIHRDMKSSNVLLDENFEARVSDFGMARLVNALDTHLSVSTLAGTPGYVPPEYYQSFRCTTKGDVYSYGIILLELLSGKKPIDSSEFGDDNNLVGWAKQLHKENRSQEILDPDLLMQKTAEAELFHCLRIAFECLDDKAFRRPTMVQVMAMFKELQVGTDNDILDGVSESPVIEDS